jgi:hypothetical protein
MAEERDLPVDGSYEGSSLEKFNKKAVSFSGKQGGAITYRKGHSRSGGSGITQRMCLHCW